MILLIAAFLCAFVPLCFTSAADASAIIAAMNMMFFVVETVASGAGRVV